MIVIIDYGLGNLGSIVNMIKKIGYSSRISSDPEEISQAACLILPGVGSFDYAMQRVKALGLINILNQKVNIEKAPILGICLGVQLFMNSSEEGSEPGLGWVNATVKKFNFTDIKHKVPHMGWNKVCIKRPNAILKDGCEDQRFYFVHSYYIECNEPENSIGETFYNMTFTSVINKENIWGTQFHPEKSHKYGMMVLKNFIESSNS